MLYIFIVFIPTFAYVQEQYLMQLYNQMNTMKEHISQLEFYTALEQFEWNIKQNKLFEEEGQTIYYEHYSELERVLKHHISYDKYEQNDIELFYHDTYQKVINLLKRLIIDKDKLIESDIKELAKLKHQTKDDTQKLFNEYSQLLLKIKEVLDVPNNISEIFKTLELLESKIMIGLFKQNPIIEIEYFLQSVDKLFKQTNQSNSKNEAIQLLSLMRSVIQEILTEIINEQLETSFDILEKELFYTQSKMTHVQAKEQLINLLNQFEQNGIKQWTEQLKKTKNEEQQINVFQDQLKQAQKIGQNSIQYNQQLQDILKAMLEGFLLR